MKYNYIIYHKNCIDGFGGFFLINKANKLEKNAIIYADVPSSKTIPPKISGKNIIIIDVAYSYDILEKIFMLGKNVLFIDHHITTKDYSHKLAKKYNQNVYFDEMYSGIGLAWKLFYSTKMPKFVKYIQDNDTGTWKYELTKPLINYLQVNYSFEPTKENLENWDKLFDLKYLKKILKKGIHYEKYKNYLLEQNSRRYSLELFPSEKLLNENYELQKIINKIGQYKVAVFNGGCPNISSLGSYMMNKINCDFVLFWTINLEKKEIVVSLRSKENSTDISQIAYCFGGGGHHSAASFSISVNKYNIQDFFLINK